MPFVERSKSGARMFKDSDCEWLMIIECLKKTGMPLKDIKEFILMAMAGDQTIDSRLELINKQAETVKRQMDDLREVLRVLEFKQWYYETAEAAGTTTVPRDMPAEELPPEFCDIRKKLRGE